MNRERLKKLITVISNVPPGHWQMKIWVKAGNQYNRSELLPQLKNLECGTAGCAYGWYCACNEMQLGFGYANTIKEAAKHFDITYQQAVSIFDHNSYDTAFENIVRQSDVIARVNELLGAV